MVSGVKPDKVTDCEVASVGVIGVPTEKLIPYSTRPLAGKFVDQRIVAEVRVSCWTEIDVMANGALCTRQDREAATLTLPAESVAVIRTV